MALALASKLGRDGALRAFTRVSASMSRAPSANQPISSQPRGSLGYRLLRHSRHLLLPACQACRAQRPKGRDKWALSLIRSSLTPSHGARRLPVFLRIQKRLPPHFYLIWPSISKFRLIIKCRPCCIVAPKAPSVSLLRLTSISNQTSYVRLACNLFDALSG